MSSPRGAASFIDVYLTTCIFGVATDASRCAWARISQFRFQGEDEGEDALPSKAGGKAKADKDIVSPLSIDAFWVQRMVIPIPKPPPTKLLLSSPFLVLSRTFTTAKTNSWSSSTTIDVITKFLKNRDVIVWCTKLARSDANECVNV